MEQQKLYSIGHGARKIGDFIDLLKKYGIRYVADVRSYPQSRFHPHFNRRALEESLAAESIAYIFMGDELGGRPKDETCYVDNAIDYGRVAEKEFYQKGIARLKTAFEKQLRVAIMCSERNPADCHRSKLIGQTLLSEGIDLLHIDEHGNLISQKDAIGRKTSSTLF